MEKSTVYIDIEDDITAIIGKINAAGGKQVRLVVPKRSTVTQSVVNLKLIKKSAGAAAKEAVLVTEDGAVNKLAARLGILTAPNLNTEPAVPIIDDGKPADLPSDVIEGEAVETGPAPGAADKAAPATAASVPAAASAKRVKDGLRKRIPDFSLFKKRFVLGALGLVGLIFLGWLVLIGLPKAQVIVAGRTEPFKAEFDFTADTEAERADYDNDVLPAVTHDISKTLSKTFNATGKKDVGTKATGTINITNCKESDSFTLSAGTTFTASAKNFLTDKAVTVPGAKFSGGTCISAGKASVTVTAAANGSDYNLTPRSYTSSSLPSGVEAKGSEMKGGVTKVINVVTQGDVDNAKNELLTAERPTAKKELANQFDASNYLIEASLVEGLEQVTSDPGIDQEATTARLILKVKYTQIGVKRTELEELMKRNEAELAKKQEATNSLGVVEEGLDKAQFAVTGRPSASATSFHVLAQALLGPDIDFEELKEKIAGKKQSEAIDIVKSYQHVTGAEVKFSPFWVRKVPRNPEKVTIEVKIPDTQ